MLPLPLNPNLSDTVFGGENGLSGLLTTLTAIISGIRSYVQSALDVIFTRFKEIFC